MANIYDMIDTWNDGATTFTAIKMDVTDTASSASSLLMDLQVGGVSKFSVDKSGDIFTSGTRLQFEAGTIAIYSGTGGGGSIDIGGVGDVNTVPLRASYSSISVAQRAYIGFTSGFNINTGDDTRLYRDAANTLAQRNGANAQAFNLYNTYTDASNYERGFMKWNANVLEIGAEAAGTGNARDINLNPAGKVRMPAGSVSNSALIDLVFDGYPTTGFGTNGANLAFWRAGNLEFNLSNNLFRVRSGSQFAWASSTTNTSVADCGIARSAAGVVKITNGSTGTGELIFIVPTTDPVIAGALWNNGGTLAISAG